MQSDKFLKIKQLGINTNQQSEDVHTFKVQAEMAVHNIKRCTYKPIECTQLTLEGYDYCLRHILSDKSAPYKQCAYIFSTNGKRCHLPAPRDKKDPGYCNEHALKTQLQNWKRSSHNQPPHTSEVLIHSLAHYIKKPRSHVFPSQSSDEDHTIFEESDSVTTKSLNPFNDIDVSGILMSGSQILDMGSDSESDVDATSFGSIWHDIHAESSDNDSIDSEQEDVLKHARLYSAEEVALIAKDKLMRLQCLYTDQYRYLQHVLRERRRRYLHALKREKETYCSIAKQTHESAKEQRLYKKLKAYNSYHRKHGEEALCSKRLHERRLKVTEGITPKAHAFTKCIYTEGGVKCGERALPVTRHCRKHILEDTNQILFRACSKVQGDIECSTPVEAIFDGATCRLHTDIPEIRSYANTRTMKNLKDSESDYDELLETGNTIIPSELPPAVTEIKSETETKLVENCDAPIIVKNEIFDIKAEVDFPATNDMDCTTQHFNDNETMLDELNEVSTEITLLPDAGPEIISEFEPSENKLDIEDLDIVKEEIEVKSEHLEYH